MTNIRDINKVGGTVFDLPHAISLSADDCNVLLVSSRTLFFIQSFATGEMDFCSRYASSFLPGNRYVLAQTPPELDQINDIQNLYELEVLPLTVDIVGALNGIQQAILTTGSNACACGTVGETIEAAPGVPGGTPPEGFGEPDPAVTARLCKAANAIHQSMLNVITELEATPAEEFLSLGFGVVAGLVSAMIAASFIPVVGLLLVGVAGAVVGVTLALLEIGLDLDNLKVDLEDFTEPLVCALVESLSATAARNAYIQVLLDAGQSSINLALLSALLTNNVLDILWFSTPDSESFLSTYVPPFDCDGCVEPGECDLVFNGMFGIPTPVGSGDLSKTGAPRVLSSEVRPEVPSQQGLAFSCDGIIDDDVICIPGDGPGFLFTIHSYDDIPTFAWAEGGSIIRQCVDGVPIALPLGAYPVVGVEYFATYFRFVSTVPFTITITL